MPIESPKYAKQKQWGHGTMIETFKGWLKEVEENAVARKKAKRPDSWKKVIWSSPDKNKEIKAKFRDEFAALKVDGKQVYYSNPSYVANTAEWLYDFVVHKKDEKYLSEIFLAMEIEMSDYREHNHRHDFNKLLQSDSRYKILVFQQKSKENVDDAIEEFKKAAGKYRFRSDSEFLLCGWSTSENQFIFADFPVARAD